MKSIMLVSDASALPSSFWLLGLWDGANLQPVSMSMSTSALHVAGAQMVLHKPLGDFMAVPKITSESVKFDILETGQSYLIGY